MKEILHQNPNNEGGKLLKEIKENVQLIEYDGKRYIIKGKRNKEQNFLEKLRFTNEKRIYKALEEAEFSFLKFPSYKIDSNTGHLILEYINRSNEFPVSKADYISAYFELQRIQPIKNWILDIYNQIFRGFFYRVFMVSFVTIPQKTNLKIGLKSILLFANLNLKHPQLKRKYWIHGDLTGRNYFYNQNRDLFFIDFENMFYTKKWFLAEIVGKSFIYDNEKDNLLFSVNALKEYFKHFDIEGNKEKFSLFLQIRFGLLQYSILQLAQSKSKNKRKAYLNLLLTTLTYKTFQIWFHQNVEKQLELKSAYN